MDSAAKRREQQARASVAGPYSSNRQTKQGAAAQESKQPKNQILLVTAGYDHSIKFWDVNSGLPSMQITIDSPATQVNKLAVTTDRKYLGVAAHNIVKVYEIPEPGSGKVINQEGLFEGHTGNITALEFQKDNKWFFTASEDGTLKVFDFKAVGFMRNFDNNGVMINTAVLHPNQGEIIFGDQSGRVRIWDLTENSARELYAEEDEVSISAVAISKDARKIVAGTSNGTCFIWKSENGEDYEPMQELIAHENNYVLKCQFSLDSKLLATCSSDKTCIVWELVSDVNAKGGGGDGVEGEQEEFEEYSKQGTLSGHGGWVWDCDITCDNRCIITVSTDQKVRIWRNGKEEIRRVLEGHTKGVTCLAFRDAPTTTR